MKSNSNKLKVAKPRLTRSHSTSIRALQFGTTVVQKLHSTTTATYAVIAFSAGRSGFFGYFFSAKKVTPRRPARQMPCYANKRRGASRRKRNISIKHGSPKNKKKTGKKPAFQKLYGS
jgi:hypothetical protein